MCVGCWILLCHERRMGRDRMRDRGKRKRKMNYGSMCVCAFKSPQARAECWESRPVPFSWPLRGGLLPSASMMENGDGTSEKAQERDNQHSWHWDAQHLYLPAHNHLIAALDCFIIIHKFLFSFQFASDNNTSPRLQAQSYQLCGSYASFPHLKMNAVYIMLSIFKNSSHSVNVGQELQLVSPLMVSLNMDCRGQSSL